MNQITRYDEMLRHAQEHFTADMLIKGTYGEGSAAAFRGCSVGCFVHSIKPRANGEKVRSVENKYALVADHYGYPEWLARLQDMIFEGLPEGAYARWHVQLAEAINSASMPIDWRVVRLRVHIGILRISLRYAGDAAGVVQRVIDLHERSLSGDVSDGEWSAAAWAAWAAWAAESAAVSAARAAFVEIRDVVLDAIAGKAVA